MSAIVLFVDDDEKASKALIRSIKRRSNDFECAYANCALDALQLLTEKKPGTAVVDLSLNPDKGPESGLALISNILALDPSVRVLVLTGHGLDDYGVKALQAGAASFLQKPVNVEHLLALLKDAMIYSQLQRKYHSWSTAAEHASQITGLSSLNPAMQKVIETAAYAATNTQPLLILGETGTGKGVIAQAIHSASNLPGAFIRFQPSFGSHDLISSELLGHKKGAFTGATEDRTGLLEAADKGTLFMDEVDELPKATQISLLNILQEKVFRRVGSTKEQHSDFRLIAATNKPLVDITASNKLREDFFHRIAHFTITIPPLRERPEDIPLLAESFLASLVNRENIAVQGITPQALAVLRAYTWPGNVRELAAKVEGGVYRARFNNLRFVEPQNLDLTTKDASLAASGLSFRTQVQKFEMRLIREALAKHAGNQSQAAESLGLDRSTLRRILERSKDS